MLHLSGVDLSLHCVVTPTIMLENPPPLLHNTLHSIHQMIY